MTVVVWKTVEDLESERASLLSEFDIDELKVRARSGHITKDESKALERMSELDFLLEQ